MSRTRTERAPSLHLEWSPDRVVAYDLATGKRQVAVDMAELAVIATGHKEALVGVARARVFLKVMPLPKAAPDDLRRILAVQIGQIFPLPADQLVFDFLTTEEQTPDGAWMTLVAAVRADDLRRIRDDLARAGLRASRVLPVALAAPAVARAAGGGATADTLLVEAPMLPPGVDHQIALSYSLDAVRGGVLRASRTSPPGADLYGEARRTLAAVGMDDALLVTGRGEGLHLPDALPTRTNTLELLHETPAEFEFELAEDREREERQSAAARSRLALLMLVSALLLVTLVWVDRSDAQAALTRGRGAWERQLSKLRSIRDAAVSDAQRATERQNVLKSAFETPQPPADIAAVVGDNLPPGTWLTGLSVERGKPVQIRGTATDSNAVARFLKALSTNARFRDVKLVVANSARIEETEIVQFNVTATAVGNLPMPAPARVNAARTRPSAATTKTPAASGARQ